VFSDGTLVGAVLDRNGLRPGRYFITDNDLVILASETGVLPIPPEQIRIKGRLQPGKLFLVDTSRGQVIGDAEAKAAVCRQRPIPLVEQHHLRLEDRRRPRRAAVEHCRRVGR
jgi:hypothetical protein